MKPGPPALHKVSVRRALMYIEKKLRETFRIMLVEGKSVKWMEEQVDLELFWMNERGAFWNYEVALGEYSSLVAIQPLPFQDWIYIELERKNECHTLE